MRWLLGMVLAQLLSISCAGVSVLRPEQKKTDIDGLYTPPFLKVVQLAYEHYDTKNYQLALALLDKLQEAKLMPSEKAFRFNLYGFIHFAQGNFEMSVDFFLKALAVNQEDAELTSRIYFNLATAYFQKGLMKEAGEALLKVEISHLRARDLKKYYLLKYKIAEEQKLPQDALRALVLYLSDVQSVGDLTATVFFDQLRQSFYHMSDREKAKFLEEFDESKLLVVAYLAYLHAENIYYQGNRKQAKELLEWVDYKYSSLKEISLLSTRFLERMNNIIKLSPQSIGVVLPFVANKKEFSERVLLGLDTYLREQQTKNRPGSELQLYIEDSLGSGTVGAQKVRKLVEEQYVSFIIGGLSPNEAQEEFLEAKKLGVPFISLSQVNLSSEEKGHLLVELSGSIESQLVVLFNSNMLKRYGKRAAILYPNNDIGRAYVEEFWKQSQKQGVTVSDVLEYDANSTDHRTALKRLLGLHYGRQRQEELDLLGEIYGLEKKSSIRRIQTLRPQIDFDWLFLPANSSEALQIIPALAYFDAVGVRVFGIPSWRSQTLGRESGKIGPLFFIGNTVDEQESANLLDSFVRYYQRRPRLLEINAYDALNIVGQILEKEQINGREQLDVLIKNFKLLRGLSGQWAMIDGLWIKEMQVLKMHKDRVENLKTEAVEGISPILTGQIAR